jgi:DtxR family Mn-dependent transcriptional regulator
MQLSISEENYLKEIYNLPKDGLRKIPNLQIGARLGLNPPAVTEMLRKLAEKKLISYSRAEGAVLTEEGEILALQMIRKHRIWETFLVKKLGFNWDEVHEVAEQLEHIRSQKLLDELDRFLGFPEFDPHGEPIPNALGIMPALPAISLAKCKPGQKLELISVATQRNDLLQNLEKSGLRIRTQFEVAGVSDETEQLRLKLQKGNELFVSKSDAEILMVMPL